MKKIIKNFIMFLLHLSKIKKLILIISIDAVAIVISLYASYFLRTNEYPALNIEFFIISMVSGFLLITIFYVFGFYKKVLRHSNIEIINSCGIAMLFYATIFTILIMFASLHNFPRTVGIIQSTIIFSYALLIRIIISNIINTFETQFKNNKYVKRIMIYGTNKTEVAISNIIKNHHKFKLLGFLEHDVQLVGRTINGQKIHSFNDLPKIAKKYKVDAVIVLLDSLNIHKTKIINKLVDLELSIYNSSHFLNSLIGNESRLDFNSLDNLTLIGRNEIVPNQSLLRKNILNKNILVTGAGGSIGSELVRQITRLKPSKLILLDNNEFALYKINKDLNNIYSQMNSKIEIVSLLGSIVDKDRMSYILEKYNPFVIFHAAAYKHVSIVEENPGEAVKVNVFGTKNLLNLLEKYSIENFVLVSTDKAVRPPNIMGATKRISEQLVQLESNVNLKTKFSIVRFGNVIGSSGSVIPIFSDQIKSGGPVTVTHKDTTRYFMTIPEAAQLILQAGGLPEKGSVYVLDMGVPLNILSIAKRMIKLSGLSIKNKKNINGDIEIIFTGLKQGEKMHEELSLDGNFFKTKHPSIKRVNEEFMSTKDLNKELNKLMITTAKNDNAGIIKLIKKIVPEYNN